MSKRNATAPATDLPTVMSIPEYVEAVAALEDARAALPAAEQAAEAAERRLEYLTNGLGLGEATAEAVTAAEDDARLADRRARGARGAIIERERRLATAHAAAVRQILPAWRGRHGELVRRYAEALRTMAEVVRDTPSLVGGFRRAAALPVQGGDGLDAARRFLPVRFPANQIDGYLWTADARRSGYDVPAWPREGQSPEPKAERALKWQGPDLHDFQGGRVKFTDSRDSTLSHRSPTTRKEG